MEAEIRDAEIKEAVQDEAVVEAEEAEEAAKGVEVEEDLAVAMEDVVVVVVVVMASLTDTPLREMENPTLKQ
jgi:hypothetical protein